jgi:hypothetical protein
MPSMVVIFDGCSLLLVIPFSVDTGEAGSLLAVKLSCITARYCRLLFVEVVGFFSYD